MRPADPLSDLPWSRPESAGRRLARRLGRVPRLLLRGPVLFYRYTLSAFMGRQCRYLPTCSAYADEALERHGAWPGLFMATARVCRCHPWGGHGFDPVPAELPAAGRWYAPWRYGQWRQPAEAPGGPSER
ncbi:membrane protein insertion efficiency factor YidD [Xanthobacter sp. V4C-4]|uniref:membrane protein insertion efficiency factor YidD n=1 Tax=Xanthobacter cornucopiae TaxID=3119924 RepID=UPI0037261A17